MTYFIDGVMMGVFNLGAAESAFKSDMFLTINMALGGTLGGPIQITDWADTYMDIDYVRWYRQGQSDTCGLSGGADSGADGSADTGVEGGGDVGAEAGADVGVDVGAEASTEAGVDAGMETGVDASADEPLVDAGPSCTCSGVGASGPVTLSCGQRSCGEDYNTYLCGSGGWSFETTGCAGATDAASCSWSGVGANGPVKLSCGQRSCGEDYNTYLCGSGGWSFETTGCAGA